MNFSQLRSCAIVLSGEDRKVYRCLSCRTEVSRYSARCRHCSARERKKQTELRRRERREQYDDVKLHVIVERVIKRALRRHGGNISRTSEALGVHRRTLQRWLRKPSSWMPVATKRPS